MKTAPHIVLVSPKTPGNIGAVARLVANFDCPEWTVVDPLCDPFDDEAVRRATNVSSSRLDDLQVAPDLKSAIQEHRTVIAFTRREGAHYPEAIDYQALPDFIRTAPGPLSFVFGREAHCLRSEELELCTHCCAIPSSSTMPTLNLSHSVAVVLSHCFTAWSQEVKPPVSEDTATVLELESLLEHMKDLLLDLGYQTGGNPERLLRPIRRIVQRGRLGESDVGSVRAILSKIQVKLGTKKNRSSK